MSPLTLFIPLLLIGTFISSKSKKAGAIFDICWTVGVLIYALAVMADGGQLLLFNIELPNFLIIVIILAGLAGEIVTLVKLKNEQPAQDKIYAANALPVAEGVEAIEGEARVMLSRPSQLVANGVVNAVTFNDKDYGNLSDGAAIELISRQKYNKLTVFFGAKPATLEFELQAGESRTVTVKNTISSVTIALNTEPCVEASSL